MPEFTRLAPAHTWLLLGLLVAGLSLATRWLQYFNTFTRFVAARLLNIVHYSGKTVRLGACALPTTNKPLVAPLCGQQYMAAIRRCATADCCCLTACVCVRSAALMPITIIQGLSAPFAHARASPDIAPTGTARRVEGNGGVHSSFERSPSYRTSHVIACCTIKP